MEFLERSLATLVEQFPIIYDKRKRACPTYAQDLETAYKAISAEISKRHRLDVSIEQIKEIWNKQLTAYKKKLELEHNQKSQASLTTRTSGSGERDEDGVPMSFMKGQLPHRPCISSILKQSDHPRRKVKSFSKKRKSKGFTVPAMDDFAYGKAAKAQEVVSSFRGLEHLLHGTYDALRTVKESEPPSRSYNHLLKKFYLVQKHSYDACFDEISDFLDQLHDYLTDELQAFKDNFSV